MSIYLAEHEASVIRQSSHLFNIVYKGFVFFFGISFFFFITTRTTEHILILIQTFLYENKIRTKDTIYLKMVYCVSCIVHTWKKLTFK